jgi:hypothetical protein
MADEQGAEDIATAVYQTAANAMSRGASPAEVENHLIQSGVRAEDAKTVVNHLQAVRSDVLREAGRKEMIRGALWCVGGILVTAASYQAASRGGTYVVAWGAIIFGAIKFFRGLARMQAAGPGEPAGEDAAEAGAPGDSIAQSETVMPASPQAIDPAPAGRTWIWWLLGAAFAAFAGYVVYQISAGRLHW